MPNHIHLFFFGTDQLSFPFGQGHSDSARNLIRRAERAMQLSRTERQGVDHILRLLREKKRKPGVTLQPPGLVWRSGTISNVRLLVFYWSALRAAKGAQPAPGERSRRAVIAIVAE